MFAPAALAATAQELFFVIGAMPRQWIYDVRDDFRNMFTYSAQLQVHQRIQVVVLRASGLGSCGRKLPWSAMGAGPEQEIVE